MLWFLALGAGLLAWKLVHAFPPGQGPFDHLPAGLTKAQASAPSVVTASSGRSYRAYTWPPDSAGKQFHVAESTGALSWVAYWSDRATGARTFYALRTPYGTGSAQDVAESAALKADFGV